MMPIVVIDTETTGNQHQWFTRVIEIGAAYIDASGQIASTFQSLVRPSTYEPERSKHATAVHGLTPNDFYYAPSVADVDRAFRTWLLEIGAPPCTAWPVDFDEAVLSMSGFGQFHWGLCIKSACKAVYGGQCGSDWAVNHLGVVRELPRHRGLPDAITEARIWIEHCRRLGL